MIYLPKFKSKFFIVLLICFMIVVFNNHIAYANDSENNETNQSPQETVYEEEPVNDEPDPEPVGKEEAIKAADRAIRWLPRPENIRFLPPDIESDIAAAQALVDTAKNTYGATDDDFADLEKLEAVKERVEKRKAIFAARDAIDLIPPPGTITEEDRDVIEEARRLVNIAVEEYGATDFDLCWRLRKLEISEDRLPEDPPDDPLPPTEAMATTIISGLLLTGAGLFFLVKRKGRFNF